jgi:hypothetical protein
MSLSRRGFFGMLAGLAAIPWLPEPLSEKWTRVWSTEYKPDETGTYIKYKFRYYAYNQTTGETIEFYPDGWKFKGPTSTLKVPA